MATSWPGTCAEAAAVAWKRCERAAELAGLCPAARDEAARFIDSHFPLVQRAESTPQALPSVDLLPCKQATLTKQLYDKWGGSVWAALTDTGGGTGASRVIQKGSPIALSVRYIGPQLRRACAGMAPGADSEFLRDTLTGHARGLWGGPPDVDPRRRFAVWRAVPSRLFEVCGAGMRSTEIKEHIRGLVEQISSECLELKYAVRVMYSRPLRAVSAQRSFLRAAPRGAETTVAQPTEGFSVGLARGGPAHTALMDTVLPSAKRLRQLVNDLQGRELMSVQRQAAAMTRTAGCMAAAPLPAGAARAQAALPAVYALFCAACGEWRSRPIVPGKLSSVVVDIEQGRVVCQRCTSPAIFRVKVNGVQLRCGPASWARLCSRCGKLVTNPTAHRDGALCQKCLPLASPLAAGCFCGRPAVSARVGLPAAGAGCALGVACQRHAHLLPTAPDGEVAHVLMQ